MTLSHAAYMKRERLRRLRAARARNATATQTGVWIPRAERPRTKGYKAVGPNGRVYDIGEVHGGSWCALEYGPRGALLAAKDFYGRNGAKPKDEARAWCESRWS